VFVAYCALLFLVSFPVGSSRVWVVAPLCVATWLLLALRLMCTTPRSGPLWPAPGWGRLGSGWALGLLAVPVLIAGLQLAEPPALAGWFSTPDRFATRHYAIAAALYLGIAALTLLVVNTRARVRRVLAVIAAAGMVQAGLAVALWAGKAEFLLWYTDFKHGARAMGTFPNSDHLAGYMELCLAAGFGWLVTQYTPGEAARGGWKAAMQRALHFMLSPSMVWRLVLIIMVVALVMTRSRMGNAAFFSAALLVGLVVMAASRPLRRPATWLVASVLVIDLVIIGQMVGISQVVDRLKETAAATVAHSDDAFMDGPQDGFREESLQQRLHVPMLSATLVERNPLFGLGGGTYALHFAPIKPPGIGLFWTHAHNDYVQIAIDIGLVGLGAVLLFAALSVALAVKKLANAQSAETRGVAVATLLAAVCMGLHSIVDFNLHVTANALTLTVLLTLPWLASRREAEAARKAGTGGPALPAPAPWGRYAALGSMLVLATAVIGYTAVAASQVMAAQSAGGWARLWVGEWARQGTAPDPARLKQSAVRLAEAARLSPDDAGWHEAWADAELLLGVEAVDQPAEAEAHYRRAVQGYQQALALRPLDPQTWAALAGAYHALGEGPALWQAWERARALGPNEGYVQPMLLDLVFANWASAPPAATAWAIELYAQGSEAKRKAIAEIAARRGMQIRSTEDAQ